MSEIDNILNRIKADRKLYPKRINQLKKNGMDTSIIERGVNEAIAKIDNDKRSFVIYGEPQSGKTEMMIALTCKLFDEGHKTIFLIMNDNTELEAQNFSRFLQTKELNPAPRLAKEYDRLTLSQLKQDVPRLIFCRKNSKTLQDLIENSRFMKKRVIIDDEADYASVDTKINKKGETSKINELVDTLLDQKNGGVYIGVTATPIRLYLNNTFNNESQEWIFLDSHEKYKGRAFFFPKQEKQYILKLLPDDKDDPTFLRQAVLRFLIRATYLSKNKDMPDSFSMLVHTEGKMHDHEEDKKQIESVIEKIASKNRVLLQELITETKQFLNTQGKTNDEYAQEIIGETVEDIVEDILDQVGRNQIVVINSKNDKSNVDRACNPEVLYTFAIGGNIVSRGLTFKNLLTFFFSRGVKGKFQQNTYIQRARMFGTRPYHKYFELCIPENLYENWADCFEDHELAIILGKKNRLAAIQRSTNRATDSASIDKQNIIIGKGEFQVGEIFKLTLELKEQILNCNKNAIELLNFLKEKKLLDGIHFDDGIIEYIKLQSEDLNKDTVIVFAGAEGEDSIHTVAALKDSDNDTISRKRGGMIQALIKDRPRYVGKIHYIMPISNAEGTRARFYYKSFVGHTILQNMKNK
tara:strand:- start:1224 stop:3134 length:1911 start_codon:yes stop_codon:yes gene_type:complete